MKYTVADVAIRQEVNGRYSINDLHKAAVEAGANRRTKEPAEFFKSKRAQELLSILQSESVFELVGDTTEIPRSLIAPVLTIEGRDGGGRSSDPKLGSDELKKSTPKEHMVKQKVRIFSLRGLNRLGLYARTEQGNLFHNWVLDLLEGRKFQNSMIQDHRKLVAFFFERRPNWRKLAELFVLRCYSLEYMALNAHMSYASARRAVRVMHARGLISSYDYESGMRNAKLAKPHFEKIVLAQAANAAKQRDMFTTEAGAA